MYFVELQAVHWRSQLPCILEINLVMEGVDVLLREGEYAIELSSEMIEAEDVLTFRDIALMMLHSDESDRDLVQISYDVEGKEFNWSPFTCITTYVASLIFYVAVGYPRLHIVRNAEDIETLAVSLVASKHEFRRFAQELKNVCDEWETEYSQIGIPEEWKNESRVIQVANVLESYHLSHGKFPESLDEVREILEEFEEDFLKPEHRYSWRIESSPHASTLVVELEVSDGSKFTASNDAGHLRIVPNGE